MIRWNYIGIGLCLFFSGNLIRLFILTENYTALDLRPISVAKRTKANCGHLLNNVSFSGTGLDMKTYSAHGCELKDFNNSDFKACFDKDAHIAFLGDSRIRQLYVYLILVWTNKRIDLWHHDQEVEFPGIKANFHWRTLLDTGMTNTLKEYIDGTRPRPTHIIIGDGVWRIRASAGKKSAETDYQNAVKNTLKYLQELNRYSDVIWVPQDPVNESIIIPMKTSFDRTNLVKNSVINNYNSKAKRVLADSGIPIWWSSYLTAQHIKGFYKNRVHIFNDVVGKFKWRILFNWQCSKKGIRNLCLGVCK